VVVAMVHEMINSRNLLFGDKGAEVGVKGGGVRS